MATILPFGFVAETINITQGGADGPLTVTVPDNQIWGVNVVTNEGGVMVTHANVCYVGPTAFVIQGIGGPVQDATVNGRAAVFQTVTDL